MGNKQKVVDLLKSIETGAAGPVAYINADKYIQHNLDVEDGLAGFGKLLQQLPPNSAKVNTVRVFEDGDYVVAHTEYNFFGLKAGIDIFRFEDGKIVEHWDNLQEAADPRTITEGATEVNDLDKTEVNKALAKNAVEELRTGKIHRVLGEGNFVLIVSETVVAGKPIAFYDLFRVENEKIAEHWDVAQEIPAKENWKNNNGKF